MTLTIGANVGVSPAEPKHSVGELDRTLSRQFDFDIQPLLKRYCFDCHQGEAAESSVDLSLHKSLDQVRENASQWEQVRGLVRIGAMPPPEANPQPTEAERKKLSQWTFQALHAFDCSEPNPPAPITVRRLNSAEYDNSVRDLFGLEIAPSKVVGFISDDVGNGFDNQGEVLSISPLTFEKYVKAAEWVASQVIVLDRNKLREQFADSDPLRPGESYRAYFQFSEGEYEIKTRLRFGRKKKGLVSVEVYIDDEKLEEYIVPGEGRSMKWKRPMSAGEHAVRIRFIDDPELDRDIGAVLSIESVGVVGPTVGDPPMPLYHQRFMIAKPESEEFTTQAAKQIIERFLPKAFRRPVTTQEIERFVAIVKLANEQGIAFDESMQFALQAILVSPEFLFRIESHSHRAEKKTVVDGSKSTMVTEVPIDPYDLASRLSYFLWSSIPDDRLFELAAAGTLSQAKVLDAEISRMLESPKADALIHGFFDQWLGLRNLQTVSVDESAFKLWSDKLSAAFEKETFLFCKELLRMGSLNDILQADFTFVNPRLADFYNLPFEGNDPQEMYMGTTQSDDYGRRLANYRDEDRWIQVDLPKNRRGLLTQAAILTLTSNPTRTSPVKRGKWVLENILGDPPPPAPPGVPSLEEGDGSRQSLSLRQQLELHRANPSCASCHRVLDPIGLGLENFDAIGNWRTTDEGSKIDADGEFADGTKFTGPRELLEHLQIEQPKIARHFATQLLTYALGRGLTRGDNCTLDSIVTQSAKANFRISEFIRAIVSSKPFLYVGL